MKDRIPTLPGRMKIIRSDGTTEYVTMERADEPTEVGTPLNKATLFDSVQATRYGVETPNAAFGKLTNSVIVNVSIEGWSSAVNSEGYYTNKIAVAGMKKEYEPFYSLLPTSSALLEDEEAAFAEIKRMTTSDGYVEFKALENPDKSINVKVRGV